jgi:hypothetical protein
VEVIHPETPAALESQRCVRHREFPQTIEAELADVLSQGRRHGRFEFLEPVKFQGLLAAWQAGEMLVLRGTLWVWGCPCSAAPGGAGETVPEWFARGRSKAWWFPLHKTRPDHRYDRPARWPFTALPMKTHGVDTIFLAVVSFPHRGESLW